MQGDHLRFQSLIHLPLGLFLLPQTLTLITMALPSQWPEPLVPVQFLSESGLAAIPNRYIKPPTHRPSPIFEETPRNIPTIDLGDLEKGSQAIMEEISSACKEWGFFQVVNHGVGLDLVEKMRRVWDEFFKLPMEEKTKFGNDPITYQGYGSRVGVEKDATLDWGDYFYLELFPESKRRLEKWPAFPVSCRETMEEYGKAMVRLSETLMKILSVSLGLKEGTLQEKFGGAREVQAAVRVNYYPKCPQPELTLGLSAHSDPGGLTILQADDHVHGLQVRRGDKWVTVQPAPNAFIVNVADQIEIISNGIYKSVEHRVIASSVKERLSVAFFYNPNNEVPMEPVSDLVSACNPARYPRTTFKEYRLYIRQKGPTGKAQLMESLKP